MALRRLFPLLVMVAAPACSDPPPQPARPPGEKDHAGAIAAPVPAALPPGTFFSRTVRGDRDRLDDFAKLRDQALAVLEEAAKFHESGRPEILREVRETFDERRLPRELEARIAFFDRVDAPAAEGIELVLARRAPAEPPRLLRLTLEDLATGGAVDGRIDRLRILWSPHGEGMAGARVAGQVAIELGHEGGQIVQHVEVAEEARFRVTAPEVTALYARAQRDVYQPFSGAAFVRIARASPLPLRARPAPPQGTSFPGPPPAPGPEIH